MASGERRRAALGLAAVLAVLAAVFAPGVRHRATTMDDEAIVFRNPVLQDLGWRELAWLLDPTASRIPWGLQYTPVRDLSHALDWHLFGDEPGPHHLQGLLLHALATAALFVLVRRLGGPPVAAAAAALLFAVHPLQVEAVAWISGRTVPLSGAFLLWSMVAWHAGRTTGARGASAAAVVLLVLANLSKQSAVVAAPLLAAVEWTAARTGAPVRGERWRAYAPIVPLVAAFTLLGLWVGRREGIVVAGDRDLGAQLRLSLSALGWYAGAVVAPVGLLPAYTLHAPASWLDERVLRGALVAGGGVLGVAATRRRSPLAAFGIVVALWSVLPVSHGLGTQVVADRYAYLPVAGVAIAAAAGVAALARRAPRAAAAAVVAAAVILAGAGSARVRVWRDDVTLYTDAATTEPGNRLWPHLLARGLSDAGGDGASAAAAREASARGEGGPVDGYCPLPPVLAELALLHERQGDLAAAEAALATGVAAARDGEVDRAAVALGGFHLRRGDRERARFAWLAAVARDPGGARLSRARLAWLDALVAEEDATGRVAPLAASPAFGQDAPMPAERPTAGDRTRSAGAVYRDASDPRVVVPKATGPGWTINFAHPWAVPALLGAFALAVGPGLLLVVSGRATVLSLVVVEAVSIGLLVGLASWLARAR